MYYVRVGRSVETVRIALWRTARTYPFGEEFSQNLLILRKQLHATSILPRVSANRRRSCKFLAFLRLLRISNSAFRNITIIIIYNVKIQMSPSARVRKVFIRTNDIHA